MVCTLYCRIETLCMWIHTILRNWLYHIWFFQFLKYTCVRRSIWCEIFHRSLSSLKSFSWTGTIRFSKILKRRTDFLICWCSSLKIVWWICIWLCTIDCILRWDNRVLCVFHGVIIVKLTWCLLIVTSFNYK